MAKPPSIIASEDPAVAVPIAFPSLGAFHRSATIQTNPVTMVSLHEYCLRIIPGYRNRDVLIETQRLWISEAAGYSSRSTMFLLMFSMISLSASSGIQV
jgi:hypothetical protein